ncbi:uncharacterized protein MONOS_9629 [Monocercomonoides exilis]|uniref:uncharacterized protein n=1 Tax=Monocercomonoides exilis TaxID=2049356 RepID=UPI0035594E8A|nr:hypothetical protein MONOS_9629 [Monocercomonoides exilis]|eukprot:MONOS_9629.1-p1 / transcript=MONOS_9629.1 / gene=MONOS_9629 / organism=Monocercomonoides_exilis_PA203 / gene_product=unspecified product / transcript_product=unspecified product / location=Mono_scaffold00404:2435-2800(-) / protein_length=122 / sequence_SO=supercontig / SO=protein_coding / is_pseudo=false
MERIKEKQGKLESAMVLLVVEALGPSGLRLVKAGMEADKQHSAKPEVCSSSPSGGTQLENRRAEEDSEDGSFGMISDGSERSVGKDVEQMQILTNDLGMNEEQGGKGGSIDLEKEEEEEEE